MCEYAEAPDLEAACELRAETDADGLAAPLDLTTARSEADWSCEGRCGETQPYCACDYWCWLFGDCCWDVELYCE